MQPLPLRIDSGTPLRATDRTGSVVWSASYSVFGKATLSTSNQILMNLRLPGQYYDQETELHYNYFRDYDSATGRYVQSDPIGLDGGINTYAYALSNPISFSDPTGQIVPAIVGGAIWGYRAYQGYRLGRAAYAASAIGAGVIAGLERRKDQPAPPPPPPSDVNKGEDCPPDDDYCKQRRVHCRVWCSDNYLPTGDPLGQGFSFFNCLNRCMENEGCPP